MRVIDSSTFRGSRHQPAHSGDLESRILPRMKGKYGAAARGLSRSLFFVDSPVAENAGTLPLPVGIATP
jgi:hypothetical protein